MRLTLILVFFAVQIQFFGADYEVIREERAGGAVDATLLLQTGTLTEEAARRCYERYSSELPYKPSLLSVKLFANESDTRLAQSAVAECESPGECRYMLRTAKQPSGPIAEVLQSPSGVVLRYRIFEASVRKTVLEGSDPSKLGFGGSSFEILYFRVTGAVPLERHRPYEGRRVHLYLQSSNILNQSECKGLTERLSKELDAPWTWAKFRADPFFMAGLMYPYPLLFSTVRKIPHEEIYAKTKEIFCQVMYGKSGCITEVGMRIVE